MIGKGAAALAATLTAAAAVPAVTKPWTTGFLGYEFEIGPMGSAILACWLARYIKLPTERKSERTPPHWSIELAVTALVTLCTVNATATRHPDLLAALLVGGTFGTAGKLVIQVFARSALDRLLSMFGYERNKGDGA